MYVCHRMFFKLASFTSIIWNHTALRLSFVWNSKMNVLCEFSLSPPGRFSAKRVYHYGDTSDFPNFWMCFGKVYIQSTYCT